MANTLRVLDLCNQALRLLGESPVPDLLTPTNVKVLTFNEHYATTRDDLLEAHFWNFATARATLRAYREPAGSLTPAAVTGVGITFTTSITGVFGLDAIGQRLVASETDGEATIAGFVTSSPAATLFEGAGALTPGQTGVVFSASAAVFAAGDVGKIIESLAGAGAALITAFTNTQFVVARILEGFGDVLTSIASGSWRLVRTDQVTADITENFPSTAAINAGDWRLYAAAPAWGFAYALFLPEDYLRIQRIRDGVVYQREGDFLVSDEEALPLTYTQRVTDVTRFPAHFVEALVAALVVKMAEPVTGQRAKAVDWVQIAAGKLRQAKVRDGQEGSPPILRASDLAIARLGGRSVGTTEE